MYNNQNKKQYSAEERAEYWKQRALNGGGGGNFNGNSNRGFSNNRSFSSNGNGQQKKHSGCTYGQDKNGNPYVRGWKFDKTNGLRSFLAVPYSKSKVVKSKSGNEWANWMVKVSPNGGQPFIVSGLYDMATRRVIIPDLQFIMNPKGGKGGYVGPYYTRS